MQEVMSVMTLFQTCISLVLYNIQSQFCHTITIIAMIKVMLQALSLTYLKCFLQLLILETSLTNNNEANVCGFI